MQEFTVTNVHSISVHVCLCVSVRVVYELCVCCVPNSYIPCLNAVVDPGGASGEQPLRVLIDSFVFTYEFYET